MAMVYACGFDADKGLFFLAFFASNLFPENKQKCLTFDPKLSHNFDAFGKTPQKPCEDPHVGEI